MPSTGLDPCPAITADIYTLQDTLIIVVLDIALYFVPQHAVFFTACILPSEIDRIDKLASPVFQIFLALKYVDQLTDNAIVSELLPALLAMDMVFVRLDVQILALLLFLDFLVR